MEVFLNMTTEAGLRRFVALSEKHLAAYKNQSSPDAKYVAIVEARIAEAKAVIACQGSA